MKMDDLVPVQCSSIFKPKTLTKRPLNCPKLSRCRIYQRHVNDSIRKTKSTALPATQLTRNNWQTRGETVSTPDLADNGISNINYNEEGIEDYQQRRICLNRVAICYDNTRWIFVFLNFVILILSILFFASALAFTVSKEILLLTMKTRVYVLLLASFYLISLVLWSIAISGLYILWKMCGNIKIHTILTLIFGIITVCLVFLETFAQKNIEENLQSHLSSSITFNVEDYPNDSWNYFHNTFKCCGVTGFLDWCYQEKVDSKVNESTTQNFLGTYVCMIPNSCCTNYEVEDKINQNNKSLGCMNANAGKIRNLGCITYIKREIHHLGKMYKVITGSAASTLILLTITSTVLFTYFTR